MPHYWQDDVSGNRLKFKKYIMIFQPWNWYLKNYNIVQSQTRNIKQLHYNMLYKPKKDQRKRMHSCYKGYSNITSFFRFVDKRTIYRWYNLIRTCAVECDWLFYWQHKLCATFSANVNINYRLPIKAYYRICTLKHIRIEINHGSQNVFWVLTWVGRY